MLNAVCTLTMSVALGGGPIYHGGAEPVPAPGTVVADFSTGEPFGAGGEQLYPYNAPMPWVHGYHQEIPAYGGYGAFAPYNYKHVLSQSQAAGGWGQPPQMPYSQQWWHAYQAQAAMAGNLEQLGSAEYAAEMARLKAREDYRTHGFRPVPPEEYQAGQTAGYVTPTAATMPAPAAMPGHPAMPPHYGMPPQGQAMQYGGKQLVPIEKNRRPTVLDSLKRLFEE